MSADNIVLNIEESSPVDPDNVCNSSIPINGVCGVQASEKIPKVEYTCEDDEDDEEHDLDIAIPLEDLDITEQDLKLINPSVPQSYSRASSNLRSDQGPDTYTCTCHAIAKCVCKLHPKENLQAQKIADDLIPRYIKDRFDDVVPYPAEYDGKIVECGQLGFKLGVEKVKPVDLDAGSQFFVWVLNENKNINHCMYLQRWDEARYYCIDSDGSCVEKCVQKSDVNEVYQVSATRLVGDMKPARLDL